MRLQLTEQGYWLATGYGYSRFIIAEGDSMNAASGAWCEQMQRQYAEAEGLPSYEQQLERLDNSCNAITGGSVIFSSREKCS